MDEDLKELMFLKLKIYIITGKLKIDSIIGKLSWYLKSTLVVVELHVSSKWILQKNNE